MPECLYKLENAVFLPRTTQPFDKFCDLLVYFQSYSMWLARGISLQKAKSIQLNKEPSSSFAGLIFPFAFIFPKNEKNKQSNKPQPLWSYA